MANLNVGVGPGIAGSFDIQAPDTYEEAWSGQIVQTSTATIASLPAQTVVVGNQATVLTAVASNSLYAVAKNGTGNYVLTLNKTLAKVKSAIAGLQCASATGKVVQVEQPNLPTQSVTFNVTTASTGAAVNLSTGDSIHFRLELSADNSQNLLGFNSGTVANQVQATYVWTDVTDSNVIHFIAGPGFPGESGNNLLVNVSVGTSLGFTTGTSGNTLTVYLTTAATTTPSLLKTWVNAAGPALSNLISIGATTGGTEFSVGLLAAPLTGGLNPQTTSNVVRVTVPAGD